ncbi:hypothetical protein [Photorhabdus africana]|uniref:hypothetical protein n=1 Tax=Photorhabdus africana TaxID=3097554 RepID=UPI003F6B665A
MKNNLNDLSSIEQFNHCMSTMGELIRDTGNLVPVHIKTLIEGYIDILGRRNLGETW